MARRQVGASSTLSAYLSFMTNTALSSSVGGGINSYQPEVSPYPTYQLMYTIPSQAMWVQYGARHQSFYLM